MRATKFEMMVAVVLTLAGCAGGARVVHPPEPVPEETPLPGGGEVAGEREPEKTSPEEVPAGGTQGLLDDALEFCQASQEFWGKGDLDSAISALDQAYNLILQAEAGDDPELIQQKQDIRLLIAKRMLEIHASRHTVVNGNHKAIPVTINADVEAEIKLFQGAQKKFFLSSYRRSGPYRAMILGHLEEAGLPVELSWLPLIESGFKLRALSSARALGLWQFIPTTGYRFGLKRDEWIDERMDPVKSTRAAIAYLQELHKIFGDWATVLAAYNCGESRVLRVIRSQNINYLDNFWDLYERLPKETRRYVPRFLAALAILQDPAKYGIELLEPDGVVPHETASVAKQIEIKDAAKMLGVELGVLETLNPELRRGITPPTTYPLRVPPGKAEILAAGLERIARYQPPRRRYVYHRIRPGETLSHLARRYRTSVGAIAKANKLTKSSILSLDQMLKVPVLRKNGDGDKKAGGGARVRMKTVRYKVQRGDSMWLIARNHKTDVQEILRLNNLDSTELNIGQELKVPVRGVIVKAKPGTRLYRVQPGDSPYTIATQHNMPLEHFLRLNRLHTKSRIYPGQTLLVDDK